MQLIFPRFSLLFFASFFSHYPFLLVFSFPFFALSSPINPFSSYFLLLCSLFSHYILFSSLLSPPPAGLIFLDSNPPHILLSFLYSFFSLPFFTLNPFFPLIQFSLSLSLRSGLEPPHIPPFPFLLFSSPFLSLLFLLPLILFLLSLSSPAGLEPAPDTPLSLVFNFDVMRRFKSMFVYLTTSHRDSEPAITATVKFGANSSFFDDVAVTSAWSESDLIPTGPQNLTFDLRKRPGASLQVTLEVRAMEVSIQEIYFDSTPHFTCRGGGGLQRRGKRAGAVVGWGGGWLRRPTHGKAPSPRVSAARRPTRWNMKSLMEGVGCRGFAAWMMGGGAPRPTYEEGSCLLYDDLQKTPLVSTLPHCRPRTPDSGATPVYATPTLRPSSTFPSAGASFSPIPRPVTLASLPRPPPIPPPPEKCDRQMQVRSRPQVFRPWGPSVTGPWLTSVYRQEATPQVASLTTPIYAPTLPAHQVTRTQILASGAFSTLSVGVVSGNADAQLDDEGERSSPPPPAATNHSDGSRGGAGCHASGSG
ncbi:hypothetical protein C7M84_004576 [Penaeus vannamei]|uniref:Uncharacterized protein n=1 Tax=Penaeus vannamei TaxID=6689 RepID=A0A3R7M9R1_PENVA|nr:hypothetical protein C7M84_004576 [Penaeus vannamei]